MKIYYFELKILLNNKFTSLLKNLNYSLNISIFK